LETENFEYLYEIYLNYRVPSRGLVSNTTPITMTNYMHPNMGDLENLEEVVAVMVVEEIAIDQWVVEVAV